MMTFLLGMVSFALSQIYLRLPLLSILLQSAYISSFLSRHFLLGGFLIGLSAGLFEESGRYLFRKFHFKGGGNWPVQALIFGLGHGLMEAIYLLKGPLLSYPLVFLLPAILERLFATLVHMALSLVVWKGFELAQPRTYLLKAILIHGLINFSVPLGQYLKSPYLSYGLFIGQSLILFAYAFSLVKKKEVNL